MMFAGSEGTFIAFSERLPCSLQHYIQPGAARNCAGLP